MYLVIWLSLLSSRINPCSIIIIVAVALSTRFVLFFFRKVDSFQIQLSGRLILFYFVYNIIIACFVHKLSKIFKDGFQLFVVYDVHTNHADPSPQLHIVATLVCPDCSEFRMFHVSLERVCHLLTIWGHKCCFIRVRYLEIHVHFRLQKLLLTLNRLYVTCL